MKDEEIIELYKQYHSCFEQLAKKYKGKFELEFENLDSEYWKGHIFEITPSKRRKV